MRRQAEREGVEAQQDSYRLSPQRNSLISGGLFSPLKSYPPSTSLRQPLLLLSASSSSGFPWLYSLQFQAVEIRVEHQTARSREKGERKERRTASEGMGQRGKEGERKQIIKAVWRSELLAVSVKQRETKRSKQLTDCRFSHKQINRARRKLVEYQPSVAFYGIH